MDSRRLKLTDRDTAHLVTRPSKFQLMPAIRAANAQSINDLLCCSRVRFPAVLHPANCGLLPPPEKIRTLANVHGPLNGHKADETFFWCNRFHGNSNKQPFAIAKTTTAAATAPVKRLTTNQRSLDNAHVLC